MDKTQSTELLFELSHSGRRTHRLPECDVPTANVLPASALADEPPPLPEVGEIDLIRHFVNLSTRNMSIDTNFYPLGSCTMKYNPKRHERLAAFPGMAELHPLQSDESCQGMLAILWELQNLLAEIAGLDGVALQPAAGAQGELTSLLVAAAYFRDKGERRSRVLIPDSAHGTNPASAALAGFDAVSVKSNSRGLV
ncbi:MAG: aminomethyl-transferring glycine dehydrogenase subunit GcvPB, partial [Gemmataceae bacterium]